MRRSTTQMPLNYSNPHHHVIRRQCQSGNDQLSDPTGRNLYGQSRNITNATAHHKVSEVPPEIGHEHTNKHRSTWPTWNVTRWPWLLKRQQQPYMGCAYISWNSTSSTNGLRWGRINKISIGEIYWTHKLYTTTPTRCTPTQEEENKVQQILIRLCSAVSPAWYFSYFIFFLSCWRTSCWCWSRRFVCSVDFSNADLVDVPLAEVVGRTGAVPGSVVATHVWLLLTLS